MKGHAESARRIREAILESGLTQQEVADKAHVSKQSVSQYLNGVHIPGNQKAGALGEVLGVRPQWIMCLDDEKFDDLFNDKKSEIQALYDSLPDEKKKLAMKILKSMLDE